MELFFADPNETPLPPEEVRIRALRGEPWSDGRRVKIYLEVDPTQKRPSAELTILDPLGKQVASVSILESMTRKMEVNMHLRGQIDSGVYTLRAMLFFAVLPENHETSQTLDFERLVVDTCQVEFQVEGQA